MIIQALPGSGKTYVCRRYLNLKDGDGIADTDRAEMYALAHRRFSPKFHAPGVVDSRWPQVHGFSPDIVFLPDRQTWLDNVIRNRQDLLDQFGLARLNEWYDGYLSTYVNVPSLSLSSAIRVVRGKQGELLYEALQRIGVLQQG